MQQRWHHGGWGLLSLTALLCACESGGGDAVAAKVNSPPLIAGTPQPSVAAGTGYSFTPAAGDSDGDSLTFGIEAKPSWATFDSRTGQLFGKPDLADAGVYRDIV